MPIPVRCFACSKVIGTKKIHQHAQKAETPADYRALFKKFRIKRYCCRSNIMTYTTMFQQLKKREKKQITPAPVNNELSVDNGSPNILLNHHVPPPVPKRASVDDFKNDVPYSEVPPAHTSIEVVMEDKNGKKTIISNNPDLYKKVPLKPVPENSQLSNEPKPTTPLILGRK